MDCPQGSDEDFGPRIAIDCRRFDFTIFFEDTILTCIPAAVFLCITCLETFLLLRQPCVFSFRSKLLVCRLVRICFKVFAKISTDPVKVLMLGLAATQLSILIIRFHEIGIHTSASIPADVLSFISAVLALVVSVPRHQRTLRPSSPVTMYLSMYTLLGVTRARTFWFVQPGGRMAVAMIVSIAFSSLSVAFPFGKRGTDSRFHVGKVTPEQSSGFWNRAVFLWLAATFRAGNAKVLSIGDLPHLDVKLESSQSHATLHRKWSHYARHARYGLIRACFQAYALSFSSAIIPRLCLSAFTFSQPFLISSTISLIEQPVKNVDYGRGLIAAWAAVFTGIAVSSAIFQYQSYRFVTRVQGGLAALIHQSSLNIRQAEQGSITAQALLGADLPQIAAGLQYLHEIWASLLDVGVAVWLLERELSLACLAPVLLVLAFIVITSAVSPAMNAAQRAWIEKIQARLKVTSTLLDNPKAVKMLSLGDHLKEILQRLRLDEIKASTVFRKRLFRVIMLSNVPLNLAPTVTLAVYVIISVYWKESTLEVSQAFTSLALIALLTAPTMLFTQILPRVVQAKGCFERVQEYCAYPADTLGSVNSDKHDPTEQPLSGSNFPTQDSERNTLELGDRIWFHKSRSPFVFAAGDVKWSTSTAVIFESLELTVERSTFTAIVGPVGSGKTALLETILGETIASFPSTASTSPLPASYCPQIPWLENKSIREIITDHEVWDEKWYDTVIHACNLHLDIATILKGDEVLVGSKGMVLSGGQKQRLALARAVYARRRLALFDDVFSGMDAHTAVAVSQRLLGPNGLLRRCGVTVVLVTNNRSIVALADKVIAIEDGKATESGRPQDLLAQSDYVDKLGLGSSTTCSDAKDSAGNDKEPSPKASKKTSKAKPSEHTEEKRKTGELSTYVYYFKNSGWHLALGNLLFAGAWMFFTEFSTIWLKWWSEENAGSPNQRVGMYMGVYAVFGIVGTLCACAATWLLLVQMVSQSAERLHSHVLSSTVKAPFWFLSSVDTGELINRFSQDMQLVDMSLPAIVSSYITATMQCLVKLVILLVFSQYLGAAVPVLGTVIYFLQRFYLRTSRQVRLLGIEAKAPLFSCFADTVDGAVTIRAFGRQRQYQDKVYRLIDDFQRPEYIQSCIQHWLAFVLDIIVAILAVILVGTIVTWRDKFDAGSVGVSLVMIVGFSTSLARVIKSWTGMESSIGAISRIKDFVDSTPSEEYLDRIPSGWPTTGAVQVSDFGASYGPNTDQVLKRVTMSVRAGEHVAICGRTGSGKTSLVLALLNMLSVESGRIEIDGLAVDGLDPRSLRKALNVVPQDAFFLPGTVRCNADPEGTASDEDIVGALEKVGLTKLVSSSCLGQNLDASAWSVGQKQLFSLARALIKKSKVLILDEAMSSVDSDTEALMQGIVDDEFGGTTVLAVTHRLDHVEKYDKVALLDGGELVEFGQPAELLSRESQFAALYRASKA